MPAMLVNEADDDRDSIHPGDRTVLIVENDLAFARVQLEAAREQGFKGLVTTTGTSALTLVHEYRPSAIMLDIFLPDIDGWRVLSRLKNDLAVRHIPVHVISTDEARERALSSGARRFVAKPIQSRKAVDEVMEEVYRYVSNERKKLLVADHDPGRVATLQSYLSGLENVDSQKCPWLSPAQLYSSGAPGRTRRRWESMPGALMLGIVKPTYRCGGSSSRVARKVPRRLSPRNASLPVAIR